MQRTAERDAFIEENIGLVFEVARRHYGQQAKIPHVHDDLISAGYVGLCVAADHYDPQLGRFSTYSWHWIRCHMAQVVLKEQRVVRVTGSRAGRKIFRKAGRLSARIYALHGRAPLPHEIRTELRLRASDTEIASLMQLQSTKECPVPDDEDVRAPRYDPPNVFRETELRRLQDALQRFRYTLLSDERKLAIFDRNLYSADPQSLAIIGAQFGVTKQRAHQICKEVKAQLKSTLTSLNLTTAILN